MTVKIEQKSYELLPVGDYKAVITNVQNDEGMFGPQLRVDFLVEGGDYEGSQLVGWCSATFSPRSKLYSWTKAAFGGTEIPPTYAFNSDDVIGRRVVLTVIIRTKDDGTEFNRIEAVKKCRSDTTGLDDGQSIGLPPATDAVDDIPF